MDLRSNEPHILLSDSLSDNFVRCSFIHFNIIKDEYIAYQRNWVSFRQDNLSICSLFHKFCSFYQNAPSHSVARCEQILKYYAVKYLFLIKMPRSRMCMLLEKMI